MAQPLARTLTPSAPFDPRATLAQLEGFGASPIRRDVGPGRLRQALRAGTWRGVVTLRFAADREAPTVRVAAEPEPGRSAWPEVSAALRRALALDLDLAPLRQGARDDPAFRPVERALHGYHPPLFPSPFEAACWALVQQRTPNGFARASLARLVELLGDRVGPPDDAYTLFPPPERVDDAARPELLAATGNTRKVERLVALGRAFAEVDEAWLRAAPYEEAYRWLASIHGLGPWSAEFVLLRGLGRHERVPWTDTAALDAISRVYTPGLTIARGSARELAERWGWYGGLWLSYLKRYVYVLGRA